MEVEGPLFDRNDQYRSVIVSFCIFQIQGYGDSSIVETRLAMAVYLSV